MTYIKPKILSGFMELLTEEQIVFNELQDKIKKVYESYGFLPIDTPVIEYSNILLAKAGGETEKQIYRFTKGDNDLALRFDQTVPLARYVAMNYNNLAFPFKRYQMSKVFRGERPQKGRYREFYQYDIDVVGDETLEIEYDALMPKIIYDIFNQINIGKFQVKINNRKLLNGFLESLNIDNKQEILRIIDKILKIGSSKVKELLLELNLNNDQVDKIIEFINLNGSNQEILNYLNNLDINNELYQTGLKEIECVINYLKNSNINEESYTIALYITRGLDYYTGTVYETYLEKYPEFGSVCSGGRYDNLADYYTDKLLPGVGISIGFTRLFSALMDKQILDFSKKTILDCLIINMDNNYQYALNVSNAIRENDIKVDIHYSNKNFKQKLKFANKIGVKYIIIIGEDEINNNKVVLKNMITGDQVNDSLDKIIEILKKELSS